MRSPFSKQRTLTLLCAICFVAMASLVVMIANKAYSISKTVDAIQRAGGSICDHDTSFYGPRCIGIGIHVPGNVQLPSDPNVAFIIDQLPSLPNLQIVNMDECKSERHAIEYMLANTRLIELRAKRTAFDDACLLALVKTGNIKLLSIGHTAVTDKGIASLANVTSLQVLEIKGIAVSDSTLSRLRESLPNLQIIR